MYFSKIRRSRRVWRLTLFLKVKIQKTENPSRRIYRKRTTIGVHRAHENRNDNEGYTHASERYARCNAVAVLNGIMENKNFAKFFLIAIRHDGTKLP